MDLSYAAGGRLGRYAEASARALRPSANCWNDGPRSGIDFQIMPSSGPVYSSRMVNRVEAPSGVSVNVRTPLNRPSGMPPAHTIRLAGVNSATFTGNARFGFAAETTLIFSPGSTRPSPL